MPMPESGHYLTINPIQAHRLDILFMKHQIEKQSNASMRFFTPNLYLAFNSADDEEADQANEAWERSIQAYQHHLDSFRKEMPPNLQRLAALCLHDADVLTLTQETTFRPDWPQTSTFPSAFVLSIRQEDQIMHLVYSLWDRIQESPSLPGWRFSKESIHWLYDEFDTEPDNSRLYWHRILFSNGEVIAIPVRDVLTITFDIASSPHGPTHPRTKFRKH